jgi:hypothetical protein
MFARELSGACCKEDKGTLPSSCAMSVTRLLAVLKSVIAETVTEI